MAKFEVIGPMKVPVTLKKAAKIIEKEDIKSFWNENGDFKNRKGCYVFSFKASRGYKPIYAGKATKSFYQEVFANAKLLKYQTAFADQLRGAPVLFFISENIKKGATNKKEIDELETFLIRCGKSVNEKILNERKTKFENWAISGVLGNGRGRPSKSAKIFKKTMGI